MPHRGAPRRAAAPLLGGRAGAERGPLFRIHLLASPPGGEAATPAAGRGDQSEHVYPLAATGPSSAGLEGVFPRELVIYRGGGGGSNKKNLAEFLLANLDL